MQVDHLAHEKEFLFTDKDFIYLSGLVGERAGIDLPETKRELLYSRLAKRLRVLGLSSFSQYCAILESGNSEEFTYFLNAITTNVTSFFRENHHFEYLSEVLFPQLQAINSGKELPRLRIWSAGCSSGKEPYSISMVLKESIPDLVNWDAKLLATDLDSNIIEVAKEGVYSRERIVEVSSQRCRRWFRDGSGANKGMIKVSDELKDLISFRQLNLIGQWPMSGLFDIIFCRNVAIYFDKKTRINIINRFADQLVDGGHLFVGHSESLYGLSQRFEPVGRTIHKKIS